MIVIFVFVVNAAFSKVTEPVLSDTFASAGNEIFKVLLFKRVYEIAGKVTVSLANETKLPVQLKTWGVPPLTLYVIGNVVKVFWP